MMESLYIGRSKIRRDLFALFFTNVSKKYYLRELQRILGYSAGSIRRELLNFQKDNLFVTKKIGNLLYYSLNDRHPLFRDLKSMVAKTVGIENSLKKSLLSVDAIVSAFIYGSFASGKEKSSSDVDLMVIGDPDTSFLNEKIAELENTLKREINPTVYSLEEYRVKKKEKSGFILELLKNPKIMIIGTEDDI